MKYRTLIICMFVAVILAPLTLEVIKIAEKRINCPSVYMTTDKEVVKIVDCDGKNITEDVSELKYGYTVVWVDDKF